MKGIAAFKTGDYQVAANALQIAAKANKDEAYYWMAKLDAVSNRQEQSIAELRDYLSKAQDVKTDSVQKDKDLTVLHGTNGWFDLWQTNWSGNEGKVIGNAQYYLNNGNFAAAHQAIDNSLNTGLRDDKLLAFNAEIYSKEKNLPMAINQISAALNKSPDNPEFQLMKAKYLIADNRNEESYSIIAAYLKDHPGDFPVRLEQAQLAYKTGKLDEARNSVDTYLKYINNPEAQYLKGQICYASGDYLDALKQFNMLLKADQSKAKYFLGRGLTYLQTRTYEFASKDLSMSLDLEPDNGEANYYMGIAEFNLGNNNMACYYWKRAKTYGYMQAVEYLIKYCKE